LRLRKAMVKNRYNCMSVDHCEHMCTSKLGTSVVAIHVDDMAAAMSAMAEMDRLKGDLGHIFNLVDLSEVRWFLGIGVTQDQEKRTVSLSQMSYIDTIFKQLNLEDAYSIHTPLDSNVILSKNMCPKTEDDK
jgi:hypothetical protein